MMNVSDSTILLRPMRDEDISEVVEIDKISFSLPWSERSYRYDLHSNPSARLWVAEIILNGVKKIVGMIVVWLIIDEVHIGTIAVHPSFRRQGIAKKLLSLAINSLLAEGAKTFTLEVRKGNSEAQALYAQFGFQVTGVRRRYYQDNGEDALIMTLNIA